MDDTITGLEHKLSLLEKNQYSLKEDINRLAEQKLKYYDMFKNSAAAIWEEDFSEVFAALKKLPCKTKQEYTNYLNDHSELLKELIDKIKILDINNAAVALFAADNKDHLMSSLDKIFISESFYTLREQFITIATGGYHYECETIGRRFDGVEFHILLTVFFPDKQGKSVFISMMDITDRIEREQQQAKLLQDTVEQKKIADILMDITFSLSSKTDQIDILNTILQQVEKVVPYSSANIMLLKDGNLIVARHRGYDKFGAADFMTKFAKNIATLGSATTFQDYNQIQIIEDTNKSPNWSIFPETSYIMSFLSMPIEYQGDIIGLLNLDGNKKASFLAGDVKKLETLCHAAAIALKNASLFEQIKRDIENRKNIESLLRISLEEKELLLKEIHHRVKNNLTIIIALINLQDANFSKPAEIELFEGLSQRIHSIALVHEKLYENNDIGNVDFYGYICDLIDSIRGAIVYQSDIKIKIDIPKNIYFDLDKLIPLGLVLNELITNSLKYACQKPSGEITVSLTELDHKYTLIVRDNGIGFPAHVLQRGNTNLGLILVNSLVKQINGSIEFSNRDGAYIKIEFLLSEDIDE